MGDALGDRMKEYERRETDRSLLPLLPIYARIDGRCFSGFTRDMDRPFDARLSAAMAETTRYLVEHTHALVGYTQSDEISLLWYSGDPKTELLFGGRVQKLASVLAAQATAAFTRALIDGPLANYATKLPHFDARVFGLPSKAEAVNCILWREQDATKNAISMAARHYYSAKELHGKSGPEMQEMLFAQGVNFNDYPSFFKRGQFFRRVTGERLLTPEERERIPEAHRPPEGQKVLRSWVASLEMPKFSAVVNREAVIFDGEAPYAGSKPIGGNSTKGDSVFDKPRSVSLGPPVRPVGTDRSKSQCGGPHSHEERLVARTITLTADEAAALMRKVNGAGGFQSLLRMLQRSYDKDTHTVRLSDDEAERVVRYTTQYGWGGFEGRLEALRDKLSKSFK